VKSFIREQQPLPDLNRGEQKLITESKTGRNKNSITLMAGGYLTSTGFQGGTKYLQSPRVLGGNSPSGGGRRGASLPRQKTSPFEKP